MKRTYEGGSSFAEETVDLDSRHGRKRGALSVLVDSLCRTERFDCSVASSLTLWVNV